MPKNEITRCIWPGNDPLYIKYHDEEWGVPLHDEQKFLEFIILEGAQAGLSWITVLRKRENYKKAFMDYDPHAIAAFGDEEIARLLLNDGLIRNKLKMNSAVKNAKAFIKIQEEFGSFDAYFWRFTDGRPIINHFTADSSMPAETPLSQLISKDMKKRGFTFMGPTICYAFLQTVGMVNDHITACFRHKEITEM